MRGCTGKISLPRRFIIDLMWASRDVPFVSLSRTLNVRPLAEARAAAAKRPGWAALFTKAFALVACDEPLLRTLYVTWPWPHFFLLPRSVATVAVARREDGEDCVLPQIVSAPEHHSLAEIDAAIRLARDAPINEVRAFCKIMRATRLPWPLRRLAWRVALNIGRQRANFFGNFGITSVSAYGPGELLAISPGPYLISYGVLWPDQTIDVVIRWDHRVADAALIAKTLTALEQVLNTQVAAELRGGCAPAPPKTTVAAVV
jgi:hypothetical protein